MEERVAARAAGLRAATAAVARADKSTASLSKLGVCRTWISESARRHKSTSRRTTIVKVPAVILAAFPPARLAAEIEAEIAAVIKDILIGEPCDCALRIRRIARPRHAVGVDAIRRRHARHAGIPRVHRPAPAVVVGSVWGPSHAALRGVRGSGYVWVGR